jgi:RHS repeat-associated protein
MVNVDVYGSGGWHVQASTTNDVGYQDLDTSSWPTNTNYYVKVEQKSNTSIWATSPIFTVYPRPDLSAQRVWISSISTPGIELTSPKVGDRVYLNFDFNVANANVYAPTNINGYLDGSSIYAASYAPVTPTGTYYPSTQTYSYYWTVTSGTHTLRWVLDNVNQVPETNEGNNELSRSYTVQNQVDLIAGNTGIKDGSGNNASGFVGQTVYFSFDYSMLGEGTTNPFNIICKLDGSTYWTQYNVTATEGSYSVQAPSGFVVTNTSHNVTWQLDPANAIQETNESNNISSIGWTPVNFPPPTLTYPDDGIILNDTTPDLAWSQSAGNVNYFYVQISTNSGFNNIIVDVPSWGTLNYTPQVLAEGAYWWRVKAHDISGIWSDWSTRSFVISSATVNPQVSVSPNGGPQGTVFSQPGTGFTPNSTANLYFSGPDGPSEFLGKVVLPDGTYQHSWTCNACPTGQYSYQAYDVGSGQYSNIATFTVTEPGAASLTPFYRLYKGGTVKDHFYTIDAAERNDAINNHGFTYERIEGFVSSAVFTGSVPLYRLYLSGNDVHYYTTSTSDKIAKVAAGYILENTYYIYPSTSAQPEWTSPLYYASHEDNTDNFYTTSWYEYWNATRGGGLGFTPHGVIGYVSTRIANNRPQGNVASVGMAVGNFSPPAFTDLSLKGVGPQLSFARYYDSFSPGTSLGKGWSFNYDSYIYEDASGDIHVEWGNGSESHFSKVGGTLVPYPGYFEKAELFVDAMNYVYNITAKDQTEYQFRRFTLEGTGPNILLTKITDRFNNSMSLYRQASYGLVMEASDGTGRKFEFTYEPRTVVSGAIVQRLTKVKDTSLTPNRTIDLEYNSQGNLWKVTDARGNTTTYGYNPDGLLNSINYPEGNTVTVTYNTLMQVTGYTNGTINLAFGGYGTENGTAVMDATNGNQVLARYQHDELYRAATINFPADGTTMISGFGSGNYVNLRDWSEDRRQQRTLYTYDANGNVTSVENALHEVTRFEYDEKNNLTAIVDPRNVNYRTILTYDLATKNKLENIRLPMGETTTFAYRDDGLVETRTEPTGHRYIYAYDNHGNLKSIQDRELSTQVDFLPDGAGRVEWKTDPFSVLSPTLQTSVKTVYTHDENDNVTSVQVGTNPASFYNFDRNNRLTHVTDPRGKVTSFEYNDMNLLKKQTSPDGKSWGYLYNSIGKVQTINRPDTSTVTYEYDDNRRLWKIYHDGSHKVTYTYDANGNVKTVTEDGRTVTMNYNEVNRLDDVTDPFGNVVSYGYDAAGNRNRITYPVSKNVIYTYDADNRLWTVTDWLSSGQTIYNYDGMGVLRSITNANGTSRNLTYDNAYRLKGISNRFGSIPINSYTLTLNDVNIPLSIERNEPLSLTVPAASNTNYTYNFANQIETSGSVSFTHDLLGNLNGANDGRILDFDYANRLIQTTISGDMRTYIYDAFGNRIARTIGGNQTRYLLDLNGGMSQVLADMNSSNAVNNYFIYGDGSLLSRISSMGQRFTYHYDYLGNTTAVTNDSGSVTEQYGYDEFGKVLVSDQASSDNPFRYVGQYGVMDEGNGLLHMRARYYDTDTGRFLSRDPLGFGGGDLNLYAYVRGNPVLRIDPNGLSIKEDTKAILKDIFSINDLKVIDTFLESYLTLVAKRDSYSKDDKRYINLNRAASVALVDLLEFIVNDKNAIKALVSIAEKIPLLGRAIKTLYTANELIESDQKLKEIFDHLPFLPLEAK